MQPYLKFIKAFKMEDGENPDLTVGRDYPVDCAFMDEEDTIVSVLDDINMVHIFNIEEEWFSEHFTLVGDVDLVMEQI